MSTDLRISVLVEDQFPEFVREEGPKLVAFIKAYYEWMESSGQAADASKNILNYQDIDLTLDKFIEYFNREVMTSLPRNVLADKKLLVKNIQDFYKARGTENAYKLLFRILYDEEIDLFYPGQEILRASDGRWQFEKVLRVTEPTNGNVFALGGQVINGLTTGATAKVDKVLSSLKDGVVVFECYISNISGEFVDSELIENTDGTITGAVVSESGKLKRVVVDQFNSGSGHISGDKVRFVSTSGSGANGQIISVSNTGSILTVTVENEGTSYNRTDNLTLFNLDRAAANAVGYPITTAIVSNPGKYTDTKGFISWNNKIQDSRYYQEFSYVIRSENVISKYREFVNNLLHPSGNKMFGEVSVRLEADVGIDVVKEIVYTSLSEIDNSYISAAIETEYVEKFESNVFEVQSPIPTTANTEYVIILEPIRDDISDLDINVEYINEVEFTHTNEISLESIESTILFGTSNIMPTISPVSFGPGRWINIGDLEISELAANTISALANTAIGGVIEVVQVSVPQINFEFLDPFAGIEPVTTSFSNDGMLVQTVQDITHTNTQDFNSGMTLIYTYAVPSIDPTTVFSSDASVNFEFLDPFVGIEPITTTVSTDLWVNYTISEFTIAPFPYYSETISGNDYDYITGNYANVAIGELRFYTLDDTERFGLITTDSIIDPVTIPAGTVELATFFSINEYQSNTISQLASTVIGATTTITQVSIPELDFEIVDPFTGVESTIVIPSPQINFVVDSITFASDANDLLSNTGINLYSNNSIDEWSGIEVDDPRRFGSITIENA